MSMLDYVNYGVPHPMRVISLDGDANKIILGRGSASEKDRFIKASNLCFDERTMSKAHCLLEWNKDGTGIVTLKDLNSFHGTCIFRQDKAFFNPTEPVALESGDIIGLVFTNKNLEDANWNVFKDSKIQLKFVYPENGSGAFAVCHLSRAKCLEQGLSYVSSAEILNNTNLTDNYEDADELLGNTIVETFEQMHELPNEPDVASASYTDDEFELENSEEHDIIIKDSLESDESSDEEIVDDEDAGTTVPDAFDYETSSDDESYDGILVRAMDDYTSSGESDDECDCVDCAVSDFDEPIRKRRYEVTDESEFYMPPKKAAKSEQPATSSWFQTLKAASIGAILGSVGTVSVLAAIGQSLEK